MTVFTIGHSTHSLTEFAELLEMHSIEFLVDVRTVPKSRRSPHFHTDSLAVSLPAKGVTYRHLPRLGGWRKAKPDSPNAAWRNTSFRGYADYAMTAEFALGLSELREIANENITAIMCSEALWWRCHRRLVADRLVARDDTVIHIGSTGKPSPHVLTEFAEIDDGGQITYPSSGD